MEPVVVGIVDENEIFRRGLVACFSTDTALQVGFEGASLPSDAAVSIVVASSAVAAAVALGVPVVVCSDAPISDRAHALNQVVGVLPRTALTPAQLLAGVKAAASGLQVNVPSTNGASVLSERHMQVLRLLAEGAATRQISDRLGYSERTIKHDVAEIMDELGARSRAEAVAMGIRRGLI